MSLLKKVYRMPSEKAGRVESSNRTPDGSSANGAKAPPGGVLEWCRCMAYDTFVAPLIFSRHPPWYDARGVSIGLAVGFGIPVGAQVITLGLVRSVYRFNFLVAVAFSFVCNPFNMIPLYYGYYRLGAYIMGTHAQMDFAVFNKLMNPVVGTTYFWEAIGEFAHLGQEVLAAWIVAALLLSIVFGIAGYVATYKIQHYRCVRRAETTGMDYENYLREMEAEIRSTECSGLSETGRGTTGSR